jgi:hypothetical protein
MSSADILKAFEAMAKKMDKLNKKMKAIKKGKHSSSSDSDSDSDAKPKRKVSEGTKAWNAEVTSILAEMREEGWTHPETGKPAMRRDAMAEAARRRSESSPEALAKYTAYRERVEKKRAEKTKKASDSDSDSEDEKPTKVKKEKKKAKKVESDSEDEKPTKVKKGKKAKKVESDSDSE